MYLLTLQKMNLYSRFCLNQILQLLELREGAVKMKSERMQRATLENTVRHIGEEARTILPRIQTLFGFQLIAVFNDRFEALSSIDKNLHLIATVCTAVATMLVLTPAAYHRQVEPREISTFFTRLGTKALTWSMVPLCLSLSVELYLISKLVLNHATTAIAIGTTGFLLFLLSWFGFPYYCRRSLKHE
ncbi:MAG: DUF6328 family protein [Pseudobdellovibrionaceae bacterium]